MDKRRKGLGALGRWRVRQGLTQLDAATRLGIYPQHLHRIEAGLLMPRADLIDKLAALYERSPAVVRAALRKTIRERRSTESIAQGAA